jgi:hypothetical protein
MAGNSDPIFSKVGVIGQSMVLKAAAADYTGVSPYNREVFVADDINGGYIQRLRFKALGTNIATVARIYINRGGINNNFAVAMAAPTGASVTTGGTMIVGTYYALVIAIGPGGSQSVMGAYSTAVTTTTATSLINWSWAAVPGATSYRLYVSPWSTTTTYSAFATRYVVSATNSYQQTSMIGDIGLFDDPTVGNQLFYDEVSLPATTASATAATVTVDVPMNLALPPGYEVYVGLGTAVAAGWSCVGIGGAY